MDYFRLIPYIIFGKLRRIYYMALPENEADFHRSRVLFAVGDSASQTLLQLAGGTFLVALMEKIGFSDGTMGVILSAASLAAVFQLPFMGRIQRMRKRKAFICFSTLQKIWMAAIFLIPLLPLSGPEGPVLFLLLFFFSQICLQICTPAATDWIASLVPAKSRGRYFSRKDTVAVFVTVTGMLLAGIAFDRMGSSDARAGFRMIAAVIAILVLINTIAFSMMKEPRMFRTDENGRELHGKLLRRSMADCPEKQEKRSVAAEIRAALQNRLFRKALILNGLWMLAFYSAAPFNSSYQVKDLKLSYTFIMIVNFIASLVRVVITPFIGRTADRIGMARMLRYLLGFYMAGYIFMLLSSPGGSLFFYIIAILLFAIAWSFVSIGLLGIQLEYLDRDKRTIQYTILSVLSGVIGFAVSLVMGRVLSLLQNAAPVFFGRQIYAQQITNGIGAACTLLVIIYLKTSVEGVHGAVNDRNGFSGGSPVRDSRTPSGQLPHVR